MTETEKRRRRPAGFKTCWAAPLCIFIDDRGLQSTNDTASCARVYQTVVTADKRRRSQRVEHDVRAKQTKVCDAERTWFLTPMRALVPNPTRPVRHHIYLQHLALRLRLSASTRLGNEDSKPELSITLRPTDNWRWLRFPSPSMVWMKEQKWKFFSHIFVFSFLFFSTY